MKRNYSSQGSPPPYPSTPVGAAASKLNVPKKKSKLASTTTALASSPPPAGSSPPATSTGYPSSPPFSHHHHQQARGRGTSRSRSRSRSNSVRSRSRSRSTSTQPANRARDNTSAQPEEQQDQDDLEDEEELLVFSDDEFGQNQKAMAKEKEDLRVLIEHFDASQMDRYEAYRRSGLNKGAVKRLVNGVLGQTVSPSILTVVRGFSKVFVGEIVERGHDGSLTPQDIREAYRLYQLDHPGAGQAGVPKKKMFVK